jgi:small conductance mechanosensitive channel
MSASPDLFSVILNYAGQLTLALATLAGGWWFTGRLADGLSRVMRHQGLDASLQGFLSSLIAILLKIVVVISAAGMAGFETSSFIAMLAAAGLAISLALQGSLSNFAGGVLILIFRPFKVGEYIEAQGVGGTVDIIQIFHTTLKTADNKTIILPNGTLSNGCIINFSRQPTRRIDLNIGIDYTDDLALARRVLLELALADARILKEPEPVVWVSALGDHAVNLSLRVWALTEHYWPVLFELQEKAKQRFDEVGLSVPFPQRTLHVHTVDKPQRIDTNPPVLEKPSH